MPRSHQTLKSCSSCEIVGEYVEKQMLACHLSHYYRPSTTTLVNYFHQFSCTWFRASLQLTRPHGRSDCSSLQLTTGPLLEPLQLNRSTRLTCYRTTIVNYDADSHQQTARKKIPMPSTDSNPDESTTINPIEPLHSESPFSDLTVFDQYLYEYRESPCYQFQFI